MFKQLTRVGIQTN